MESATPSLPSPWPIPGSSPTTTNHSHVLQEPLEDEVDMLNVLLLRLQKNQNVIQVEKKGICSAVTEENIHQPLDT